jgi:two-component sensor histidine kinase
VTIGGRDVALSGKAVTSFALLLYEFATNAAKYGALSTAAGRIDIECSEQGEQFLLTWTDHGAPTPVEQREEGEGYGRLLERATVKGQLDGEIVREWKPDGLTIRLSLPLTNLTG